MAPTAALQFMRTPDTPVLVYPRLTPPLHHPPKRRLLVRYRTKRPINRLHWSYSHSRVSMSSSSSASSELTWQFHQPRHLRRDDTTLAWPGEFLTARPSLTLRWRDSVFHLWTTHRISLGLPRRYDVCTHRRRLVIWGNWGRALAGPHLSFWENAFFRRLRKRNQSRVSLYVSHNTRWVSRSLNPTGVVKTMIVRHWVRASGTLRATSRHCELGVLTSTNCNFYPVPRVSGFHGDVLFQRPFRDSNPDCLHSSVHPIYWQELRLGT